MTKSGWQNNEFDTAVLDDGLCSMAWTEYPVDEYSKEDLKEEEVYNQEPSSKSLRIDKHGNSNKAVDDIYNDDDLPNAIKLMDEITLGEKPKERPLPIPPLKKGVLEQFFSPTISQPLVQSLEISNYRPAVDAMGLDQASMPEDLTVNHMIHEMEQQEEELMFGPTNEEGLGFSNSRSDNVEKEDNKHGSGINILTPVRRSLLPAMHAGRDDSIMDESLAGSNTVNEIILKMENDDTYAKMVDQLEDGTIRTWTNFNPIARSVASRVVEIDGSNENESSPSAPLPAADNTLRGMQKQSAAITKSYFVDDDTSVGSIKGGIEVVVKKRRSRSGDHENDADTMVSYGNQNTLVSSLSYDETYYRLGRHHQLGALPTTEEEPPFLVADQRVPDAADKFGKDNGNGSKNMPSPQNSIMPKLPIAQTTFSIEFDFDTIHFPTASADQQKRESSKSLSYPEKRGFCEFTTDALRNNKMVRCLVLLSSLFFAAFAGLGVVMLTTEQSQGESTSDPFATPPPFDIEFDGTNITFDYNGTNVTSMPSEQPAAGTGSPSAFQILEPPPQFPTQSPANGTQTLFPTTSSAESFPTTTPTESPSASADAPTSDAVDAVDISTFPPDDYTAILLVAIRQRLPETFDTLEDPTTPQYRALAWIAANPPREELLTRPVRIFQRWVMVVLFYSTNGEGWVNSSGWLTDSTECSWYSTSSSGLCDDNGFITEIDLRRNGLRGTIPAEILLLEEKLLSIRVNYNSMTGTIPHFLAELVNLERLQLEGNRFQGTIPASLENLSSTLWSLRLGQMGLTGTIPSQLGSLTLLEYLSLATNRLGGTIPSQLGNLSRLVELDLFDNQLSGTIPQQLVSLTSLVSLELNQNDLEGSIDPEFCATLDAPETLSIEVDCDEVSCSCCEGC
jgi:hypothetical protein